MTKICFKLIFILWLSTFSLRALASQVKLPSLSQPHDGQISLYVYHVNEYASIQYLDQNRNWIPAAYDKLNLMLRSRGEDATTYLDRRLIELADHLQDHFKVDTIEVISAYRSSEFNKSLKDQGRNVANQSFHIKGMAMDIHIDEINEATLRDYLRKLNLGGVGYYGDRLMVHMDFGPQREWHGGAYRENTDIGIFNDKSSIKIWTDKLFYKLSDQLKLNFKDLVVNKELVLQRFQRGSWQTVSDCRFKISSLKTDTLKLIELLAPLKTSARGPYGKFRFRFENKARWQHSNEFYVKKL